MDRARNEVSRHRLINSTLGAGALVLLLAGCPDDDPNEEIGARDVGGEVSGDVVTVDVSDDADVADEGGVADTGDTTVEGFSLSDLRVDGASLDALAPDTDYTLLFSYQAWNAASCAGCELQLIVRVGEEDPTSCAFEGSAAAFPGESGSGSVAFSTPATTGALTVVAGLQDEASCAEGIADLLDELDEASTVATLTVVEPFEVVSVFPEDEAENVDLDEAIVATFSRAVDLASLSVGGRVEGPAGVVSGSWSGTGTEARFTPDGLLTERRSEYDVRLDANVSASDGASPLAPFEWSFLTQMVSDDFAYNLADSAAGAQVLSSTSEAPALVWVSAESADEGADWVFVELDDDRYRLTTLGWDQNTALDGSSSSAPVTIESWQSEDGQRWYFTETADESGLFYLQNDELGDGWVLGGDAPPTMIAVESADDGDAFVPLRGDSLD